MPEKAKKAQKATKAKATRKPAKEPKASKARPKASKAPAEAKPPKLTPEQIMAKNAETCYREAIMRHSVGDKEGSLAALTKSLEYKPDYPPAVLTMASIQYQAEKPDDGKKLLFSLLSLPKNTPELFEVIDEAGSFLVSYNKTDEALELYKKAAKKYPEVEEFQQRVEWLTLISKHISG